MREKGERGELPKGWVWARLEDISEVILGQSPPSSSYNQSGEGLPFYQGKLEFGKTYPTPRKWCTEPHKVAAQGDVLISVRAPVGPTNICPHEACIGRGLAAIRGMGGIQPEFLLYALRAFEQVLASEGTGTTFQAISGKKLRGFAVPLPPLAEQHRIVAKIEELLTQLDAGVEALNKVKAQLRRYRQAVLKAAFEGKLTEAWRERHGHEPETAQMWPQRPGAARSSQSRDASLDISVLPELPKGWTWSTVGAIGEVSGGLTKNSKRAKLPRKMPYLRVANVYAAELRLDEVKTIGVQEQEVERALLRPGDLLVVEGNGSRDQIGRVAIWDGSIDPCLHQNHIIKVRFTPAEVAKFALLWLLSDGGRDQITQVASSTSGLYTLSISKVGSLPMPVAPLPEQREIVAEVERRFSVADQLEAAVEQGLKRAERLRQSILKRAFEGRLVPQDPTDEPAAVLLERIRALRSTEASPCGLGLGNAKGRGSRAARARPGGREGDRRGRRRRDDVRQERLL